VKSIEVAAGAPDADGRFRPIGTARDWNQALSTAARIRRVGPVDGDGWTGLYEVAHSSGDTRWYLVAETRLD
jgi:hypothetical protein